MALSERLQLLITANGAQAVSEMNRVGAASTTSLGKAETSTKSFRQNLIGAGASIAGFAGIAGVALIATARAAAEEDLAIARLNNTISNSPELAGASADAFLDQAAALQDTTKFADDATIGLQALLGQFGLTQDQILQLTPLVLDLSSKMGISLESAAKAVGRATQGTAGGLSRMIGQFDTGDTAAENFAATVDALSTKVGGFAETEGQSLAGQLAIVQNNLGDVAEEIGRSVTPAMTGFIDALGEATPLIERAAPLLQGMSDSSADAAGGLSGLVGWVADLTEDLEGLADVAGPIPEVLGMMFRNLNPVGLGLNLKDAIVDQLSGDSLEDVLGGEGVFSNAILGTHALVNAQADLVIASAAAEAGFEGLADGADDTTDAVSRLSGEWNGLTGRLNRFDAANSAADALFNFRDALTEAQQEGGINRREMVGLNQGLSRLIGSYQRAAEAQATAADGTVNFQQRNRTLRTTLAGLAAFIPAQLRPQFQRLTEDVLAVPDNIHITATANADQAISEMQQLYGEAVRAATAVGQTGGSLAGGGTYSPPESGERRVPYRGSKDRVTPVMVVGGRG